MPQHGLVHGRQYNPPNGQTIEVYRTEGLSEPNDAWLARKRLAIRRAAIIKQFVGIPEEAIARQIDRNHERNVKEEANSLIQTIDVNRAIYVHGRLPAIDSSPGASIVGMGKAIFFDIRAPKDQERRPQAARNAIDIKGVYVEPEYQGRGIGSAMTHFMLDELMRAEDIAYQMPVVTRDYPELNPRMQPVLALLSFGYPKDIPHGSFGDIEARYTYYVGLPALELSGRLETAQPWLRSWQPIEQQA